MSPTVFRHEQYRFFFFSREEARMHVHIQSGKGEAKFWLEPEVALAQSHGLSPKELRKLRTVVEDKRDEIEKKWRKHFGG